MCLAILIRRLLSFSVFKDGVATVHYPSGSLTNLAVPIQRLVHLHSGELCTLLFSCCSLLFSFSEGLH